MGFRVLDTRILHDRSGVAKGTGGATAYMSGQQIAAVVLQKRFVHMLLSSIVTVTQTFKVHLHILRKPHLAGWSCVPPRTAASSPAIATQVLKHQLGNIQKPSTVEWSPAISDKTQVSDAKMGGLVLTSALGCHQRESSNQGRGPAYARHQQGLLPASADEMLPAWPLMAILGNCSC